MPLLLLADEQEDMVERYLEKGDMFVLTDGEVKAECVVTHEEGGILEIKNIAVKPEFQRKGYGRLLVNKIENHFKAEYKTLRVGTGDSPLTVPFYQKLGFKESFRIKNFFTDNYRHPIIEAGVRLVDMVVFEKPIDGGT